MYFNRKNAEQKNWRMIKKGKHFLFGCSLVFAVGATLATPTVQADTAEAKVDATVGTAQAEPTAEAPTYAAPAATSPVATEAVEANSATTAVSVDKSQLEAVLAQAKAKSLDGQEASVKAEVATAIAEAEALVANGSASQEQVNQSVERLTQAVASVKEVTEAAIEKTSEATTESSATPKVRSRRATTEGTTRSIDETNLARAIVTKENFESFFQEGGTASYEKSSGTIKLTEDVSGQAGNAYLRFKIDPSQDFSFTGKVDIGNKYEGHEVDGRAGGDGVGFVFHTGKQSQLGLSGASIGMGGINAAFGFKLDSWWNKGTPKPEIKSMADPSYNRGDTNHAFGAFYSSNNQGRVNSITEMKPLNPAPNGQWVDFKINYNGTKKEFTVTYGSQTWTTKLDKSSRSMTNEAKNALTARNATYALSFVGSTGSGTNLQRVQIEKFEFTAPQIVHMKFVDESGQEIEASSAIPGDENEVINLSTQDKKIAAVEAKGYTLKEIDSSKAPSYIKENNTVTLTPGGQLLTYVFKVKDTTPPAAPTVNSVTAGATAVTGTAEAGSTVEVTLPGGSKVSAKADQDGSYSVPVSALKEGDTVSVTATDDAGNKSTPTSVTVPDKTAPAAPTVNPVKAGATAITGTAEAGSTVEVTLQDGQKSSAKAGENGEFSIPVPALNADDQISVTATDVAKNTSTPTKVTVKETVRPTLHIPYDDPATQAIYVYSGEENNIELKVTDNSGKIVKAYLALPQDNRSGLGAEDTTFLNGRTKGGLYLKTEGIHVETTATESTPAIVRVTGEVPKNTYTESSGQFTRYLFAEDAAGNTGYEHVGDATTPGQLGRIRFMWKPQTFKYTAVAPSTPITSNTVPEASAIEKAVKDANPTFSDKIGSVTLDGTNVTVTYKDGSTDVIPANSVFTIEPTAPTVTPVKNPSSLTQPEKDAVKKAVEAANKTATKVEVGTDGTTTLTYSNGSTAKLTPAQTVSQADVTPPVAPTVNAVTAGATAITGTAEKGSTVEVTLPDGQKASAKAGEDGTFSVPVSALKEGDTVSVTATDDAGNKSTPVSATVPDTTAPEAPTVNPVKAGDKAVTGTAEAGSTVEVTLPDGTKATATADKDGNFSVPVSGLEEGQTVSVTAKDASNNTSAPTTATVAKADDTKAPDAPSVNPVKAGDKAVTGTAEAGSTVEVTLPDGTKATATADKDGNFSVPVSGLEEGQTVSVTAKDASNNTSAPTTATVAKADDTKAPDAPSVNPVKAGDKAVTGTAEAGSTVEVTLPDGTKATATADKDGNFSVPVSGLEEGQTVSVTAKDASNNTSAPTTATVAKADDTKAPDAPSVNPVKAGDKAVTGTAEAGSTVEVTLPDGTKATATADKDGKFNIPVAGLKAGDKVSVTATDAAGNKSGATDATVAPAVPVVNDGKVSEANGAKAPALTPVVDPSNLTDAEKAKVAEEVKKANPTATDVKVNNDGSVVVTFADGSVATIAANKVVKEATKESSAQAPAKKAGAKELPNTGTKQSNASLGLALLAAVTGGLLISKKRKEEE
ncbi:Ig-like domain-containing protein [Streptococcus infantis]|uniref:Ig-like domain-containing protein n=6 Tax=Streptococcus TaxID=1301 RepID=UPI0039C149E4